MFDHLRRQRTQDRVLGSAGLARAFTLALLGLGLIGCTTPQFSWRNPFEPSLSSGSASTTTPTIAARVADVQSTREGVEYLSEAERMRVSTRLAQDFGEEPHPIVRQEIAKTLGGLRTPSALEGLRMAVRDGDREVRVAACESLAAWGTTETYGLLAEVLHSDTDVDVRLAATRLLGSSQEATTIEALGRALDDADPAVQYLAVQSLQQATGRKVGNDLKEWKRIARQLTSPDGPTEGGSVWR